MARASCPCCNLPRPVAAMLRRRALRWEDGWRPDLTRAPGRHPLCGSCQVWLAGILGEIHDGAPNPSLYGSPSTDGRLLLFDDQCEICHNSPAGTAANIDCVAVSSEPRSWPMLFVCSSCDAWIAGLASDGRSARGRIDRGIDGPYGEWLHPNLRELSVEVEVADRGARATVFESCLEMEVPVRGGAQPASPAVLFVEASLGGDVTGLVRGSRASRPGTIVMAAFGSKAALQPALLAGATGWLTIPVTPQQVTAALTGAMRRFSRRAWDPVTCLPIASLVDVTRPAMVLDPAPGVDAFDVAWLAKRFSRGYDDLAVAGGQIVLLPRAPADRLPEVAARIQHALDGRCTVRLLEPATVTRARFEAIG